MTADDRDRRPAARPDKANRQDRLKAKLRENLRRRKSQLRGRVTPELRHGGEDGATASPAASTSVAED